MTPVRLWLAGFALMAVIALTMTVALAQSRPCAPEQYMIDMLYRNFREFVVRRGEGPGGEFILTRAVQGDGSWSLLRIEKGERLACFMATGGKSRFDRGI